MADPIDTGKKTVTGRTIWRDPETGEDYSERSTTFEIDGKYYTMPTVAEDGSQYTDDQIRDYVKKYGPIDFLTGEELPKFKSQEDAIEYAISRSNTRKKKEEPMLEEQMELFNEGGLRDEGGTIDPESGNDVPIGSMKKEVRDDIPAMLSEGEFVLPADVVRYIGLENLMKLRQDAKMGLKRMEAMGQMGNSEEATIPDDLPFGPADLVILGKPQEAEPKEMYSGGMVYANQGTFATGIGGSQPSIYQGQTLPAAPAVPPSSVAPPTPTPAPAGGFIPTFVGQPIPDFTPNVPSSPTPVAPSTPAAPATPEATTDDDFFKTADQVFESREYINPDTGERRTFNFMNGLPVTPIPDGFIPLKDYESAQDAATDDLLSTSVETTMVRDDTSITKRRLEDMVRDQGGNKLRDIKDKFNRGNKKEAEKDLINLYIENEKTKSLMTALGILNPAGLVGRGFTQLYGKQLEKLMTEQGIEIPKIETGFLQNLKDSLSGLFTGMDETSETYNRLYDPSDSPLSTVSGAENMLTDNEARAYDNAVKSGNARVAEHYEIINNRLNKMKDYAEGKPVSGLSKFDIEQAQKMFDSKGNKKAKITSAEVKGLVDKTLDTQTKAALTPTGSDDIVLESGPAIDRAGFPGMEQIDLSGMGAESRRPSVQTDMVGGINVSTLPKREETEEDIIEKQREKAREDAAADRRKDRRRERAREAAKAAADRRKAAVKKAKSISKDVKGKGAKAVDASRSRSSGPFAKGGLAGRK